MLPTNKKSQALPILTAHNIGSITREVKDKKKGVELVSKFHAIGLIDDFIHSKESNSCKLS